MKVLNGIFKESREYYKKIKKEALSKLAELPKGNIKKRKISNQIYYYLQFRKKGKVIHKYLGKEKPDKIIKEIKERDILKKELKEINKALLLLKKIKK